jgi:predicted amidohydrolase
MRVLLAQLAPAPGDAGANVAAVEDALRANSGAELAVFPELFLSGYEPARARERALDPDGPELARVGRAAREHDTAVVVGFAERAGDAVRNSVALFDRDGARAGVYAKTHLFGADEQSAFQAGDALSVASLSGARVAPLICFDVEFPEPARALASAGAELLVTVAANPPRYARDHELASRARALDNRRPHVYVNRVGDEAGITFAGESRVLDPSGDAIVALSGAPELRVVDVELSATPEPDVDYLRQVRADLRVAGGAFAIQGGDR